MNYISENTQSIAQSKIREMFNLALGYDDAISFTIGEPDFTASEEIAIASCKAIMEGKSKYSENAGIMPLREAISQYLKEEIGMEYDPATEITATTGAMCGIYQALKVILNPGDEVIVIEPCWTNYVSQITMCEGKPVSVVAKAENGFNPDIEDIKKAVTPKTRALIINSPCNPTGTVMKGEVLRQIADLAKEKDFLFLFVLAGYFGDFLKVFKVHFPMTSFRLSNMTTDNVHDLNPIKELMPNLPFSRMEGIDRTLAWMEKQGEGK